MNIVKKIVEKIKVCISKGNRKMGAIPSVSLPAIVTCRKGCKCCKGCYAAKLERIYKNVRESYQNNLKILMEHPDIYWKQVKEAVAKNRFFRFHVSGDIPTYEYLEKMVETAEENPNSQILCFTKQYEFVNKYLDIHGEFPKNLHLILSVWRDFTPENPHNLPEAHVRFKDGYCNARADAIECFGNCTNCTVAGCGCWNLKSGEQVVFNQH